MKRVLLAVIGLVLIAFGGGAIFALTMKPAQRPALDVKVELTPERIERGRYLANNVFPCMDCHSNLDPLAYGSFPIAGTEGAGGDCFTREMGFPGYVCPRNITPDQETGIGAWTDGEILRAMREGVDRNGRALFPMMPYELLKDMPDDDAYAVVAYLRSLPPIKRQVKPTQLDFPISFFIKLAPKPLDGPVAAINHGDRTAYGRYLTKACYACHSPVDDHHQPLKGKEFSGGQEFKSPDFTVYSANLTFDETGQGTRTKEQFIALFAAWRGVQPPKVAAKDNTAMPWHFFSGMTDDDLGVVYDYLKAQPKVANKVERRVVPALAAPTAAAPTAPAPAEPSAPGSP